MIELITTIRSRLRAGAYGNEAAVREGIIVPVLRELGWDTADTGQVSPEHFVEGRFLDYALFGRPGRVAAVIEAKAVGRWLEGDKQLFRYCFDVGAPLAVLTNGRTWNFYLPSGSGTPDERRFYSLDLEERASDECATVFDRYLARARVLDRSAFRHANEDYERALSQRDAIAAIPSAWSDLIAEGNELIIEQVQAKAESFCGYAPSAQEVVAFLAALGTPAIKSARSKQAPLPLALAGQQEAARIATPLPSAELVFTAEPTERGIPYTLFSTPGHAPNASRALVDILRTIVARDPTKLPELGRLARTRGRNLVAQSPQQINPARPDLARGEEISTGWLVGLTVSNRDKLMILRAACDLYGLSMPGDLDVKLPNT